MEVVAQVEETALSGSRLVQKEHGKILEPDMAVDDDDGDWDFENIVMAMAVKVRELRGTSCALQKKCRTVSE